MVKVPEYVVLLDALGLTCIVQLPPILRVMFAQLFVPNSKFVVLLSDVVIVFDAAEPVFVSVKVI